MVIEKSGWGPGPWQDEPDRVEWRTDCGLPGLITRNPLQGNLCGYVAVPPGHPLHGREADGSGLDAHGSVNYSGPCRGHVCHVPAPGEPDDVWWFGFDCAHPFDYAPALEARFGVAWPKALRPLYRDVPYVREQVEQLAAQLVLLAASTDEQCPE